MARGIDHLVLAVRDLDEAGAHYEAMGFRVGARNLHPWGTENRIVQFPGAFLELLATGEQTRTNPEWIKTSRFTSFFHDYCTRYGEGFAMLVLEAQDAAGDKAVFDAAGIGGFDSFFFERFARRPAGEEVRVAFTLAFAADRGMPDVGCFTCQHHEPQNFWNPVFQKHENGATAIAGVIALAPQPSDAVDFFQTFTGERVTCIGSRNMAIVTPRGSIEALTPECYRDVIGIDAGLAMNHGARFAAFKIAVPLAPFESRLEKAGIDFRRHRKHLVVAAKDNFGTAIVFEEPGCKG